MNLHLVYGALCHVSARLSIGIKRALGQLSMNVRDFAVGDILTSAFAIMLCACGPGPNYDLTEPLVGQIAWTHSLDGHQGEAMSLLLPKKMGTLEFPADTFPADQHVVVRVVELNSPPGALEIPLALQIAPSNLSLPVAVYWRKDLFLPAFKDEVVGRFSTGFDDNWAIVAAAKRKTELVPGNGLTTQAELRLDRTGLWRIELDKRPFIVRIVGRYVLERGSCSGGPWGGAAVQALSIDVDGRYVWLDTALSSDPPVTIGLAFMAGGSVPLGLFSSIQRDGDGFTLKLAGGTACPGNQSEVLLFRPRTCDSGCAAPLACIANACGPPVVEASMLEKVGSQK